MDARFKPLIEVEATAITGTYTKIADIVTERPNIILFVNNTATDCYLSFIKTGTPSANHLIVFAGDTLALDFSTNNLDLNAETWIKHVSAPESETGKFYIMQVV